MWDKKVSILPEQDIKRINLEVENLQEESYEAKWKKNRNNNVRKEQISSFSLRDLVHCTEFEKNLPETGPL